MFMCLFWWICLFSSEYEWFKAPQMLGMEKENFLVSEYEDPGTSARGKRFLFICYEHV